MNPETLLHLTCWSIAALAILQIEGLRFIRFCRVTMKEVESFAGHQDRFFAPYRHEPADITFTLSRCSLMDSGPRTQRADYRMMNLPTKLETKCKR